MGTIELAEHHVAALVDASMFVGHAMALDGEAAWTLHNLNAPKGGWGHITEDRNERGWYILSYSRGTKRRGYSRRIRYGTMKLLLAGGFIWLSARWGWVITKDGRRAAELRRNPQSPIPVDAVQRIVSEAAQATFGALSKRSS